MWYDGVTEESIGVLISQQHLESICLDSTVVFKDLNDELIISWFSRTLILIFPAFLENKAYYWIMIFEKIIRTISVCYKTYIMWFEISFAIKKFYTRLWSFFLHMPAFEITGGNRYLHNDTPESSIHFRNIKRESKYLKNGHKINSMSFSIFIVSSSASITLTFRYRHRNVKCWLGERGM